MALLIAVHGVAGAALSARAPLHTHTDASKAAIVVLEDVRRGPAHSVTASEAALLRHGHSHDAGTALRHYHTLGDSSVTLADGEAALHADNVDDASYGAALGALIGLVPSVVAWLPHGMRDVAASRLAWVPQTHHPEPFERPPRAV